MHFSSFLWTLKMFSLLPNAQCSSHLMTIDGLGHFPLVSPSFLFSPIPSSLVDSGYVWVTHLSLSTGDRPFICFNLREVSHLKGFNLFQRVTDVVLSRWRERQLKNRRARIIRTITQVVQGWDSLLKKLANTNIILKPKQKQSPWPPDPRQKRPILTPNAGKGMEKRGPLYITGGKVQWHSPSVKQWANVS